MLMTADTQNLPKKRRRLNRKKFNNANVPNTPKSVPKLDDTTFRLDRAATVTRTSSCFDKRSLPALLNERQTGLWSKSTFTVTRWQQHMIQQKQQHPIHRSWRPYTKRRFCFRQLQTPASDIVLGFDAAGDHVVALGGKFSNDMMYLPAPQDHHHDQPPLALRFYGLPSPSTSPGGVRPTRTLDRATPIMSVPLDYPAEPRSTFLPATIPITVMMADETIGITYTDIRSRHGISAVTLFPMPRVLGISAHTKVYSIRIPGLRSCFISRTNFLPVLEATDPTVHERLWNMEYNVPGHVVVLNSVDTLRFVWVQSSSTWTRGGSSQSGQEHCTWTSSWPGTTLRANKQCVHFPSHVESHWRDELVDRTNGLLCEESSGTQCGGNGLQIVFELSISAHVLAGMLSTHFKEYFDFSHKEKLDFKYVNERNCFRAVEVLINWPKIAGEGGLAAFILIDLQSGDYKVLRWIRERPDVFDNVTRPFSPLLRVNRNKGCKYGALDTRDDSVWDFLESPTEKEGNVDAPYWIPKTDLQPDSSDDIATEVGFSLNNFGVIDETPLEYINHLGAPVSMLYE